MSDPAAQPAYLLFDCSGSTSRTGLNQACNEAIPELVKAVEASEGISPMLSILTYGGTSELLVSLSDAGSMKFIPKLEPSGFSSLAAGLRLLGRTVSDDGHQLTADGLTVLPALVVIVTDGQTTDGADDLRLAYQDLCSDAAGLVGEILVVLDGSEVAASIAGLGQGLSVPSVDLVELPIVDGGLLSAVLAGWLTRERSAAS